MSSAIGTNKSTHFIWLTNFFMPLVMHLVKLLDDLALLILLFVVKNQILEKLGDWR